MSVEPSDLLELARSVGTQAAEFVRASRPEGRVGVADTKTSPTDVVTELDRRTEDLIRSQILAQRPDDSFMGEEGESIQGTSGVEWIVDPIDGTVNFVYGIPAYAVSIAASIDGTVTVGFVIDIPRNQSWGSIRGSGSWRYEGEDRRPLTAPTPESVAHALVATGFSYVPETRAKQAAAAARFLPHVRDIRRGGSAAIDLCGLAEGRFDAYVEQGLYPWDLAAGGLIAEESGIVLSGFDGPPDRRLVMAAHPSIAQEYFTLVRACGF